MRKLLNQLIYLMMDLMLVQRGLIRVMRAVLCQRRDVENQADEDEDGDEDNGNEEEAQGSKEDESKSAIKWTDDDQKNLMDLGTLELERNLRLESLIRRRRARRNMRLMAEKNLIDLDAADLPINVPSISTARQNPFDFPYDDVPGSAPSVLLPRQKSF
ncbi:hypothetical protein OIU78_022528 [Salix suchowensis]|nr:hypothetical protein OIU78_022528 [Salix suchowensis]